MTDLLNEICEAKRVHIRACKSRVPEEQLYEHAKHITPPRGFRVALEQRVRAKEIGWITECKKSSPSGGILCEHYDPAALATAYAHAGATCLSVLTDTPYFQGKNEDLIEARAATRLPVLRKDFMVDVYQILESRSIGADCVLLIMAALSDVQAQELESTAHELGMDVIIEVHSENELNRALTHLRSRMIGINHRNLKTLTIDLAVSEQLRSMIPADYLIVGESGIRTPADIARLRAADIHCFLIGESLLRTGNVETAMRQLSLSPQGEG